MTTVDNARLSVVRGVERLALILRYLTYGIATSLFLLGHIHGSFSDLFVVTVIIGSHNAFAHWALWTKRYELFFTRANFAVYFGEACLVVAFTGAEASEGYVLFILLIIGFSAYTRRPRMMLAVTGLLCAAYAFVIFLEWLRVGLALPFGIVVLKGLNIALCGVLVTKLSQLLRDVEGEARNRAEELLASEATLRTILDHTADPIVVFNEQEFVTEANNRACAFLGTKRDALIGKRFRNFVFDDGTLPNKLARLRARGEYHGEQILVNALGDERTVDIHVRSYVLERQRYFVAVMHDMTERKDLHEATQLANARLKRLNEELSRVHELRAGFLETVAERFRSPLTAVLGYVEMLIEEELGSLNADQREALHVCRRGVLRAFELVEQSLDVQPDVGLQPAAHAPDRSHSP